MEMNKTGKTPPLILIVDDVETNRFILRDIIAEMGYLPVLTENGIQALKLVERRRPQLIILDVAMPEMDGYEFCRIMKENVNTRDIPIIFISAFDDPADVVKGFNLGGADYVTKPFIPEVVKARVGLHLKLSETSKDLAEINKKLQASITEQLNLIRLEKKNVLYALLRVMKGNYNWDKTYMDRVSYNAKVLAEAMQLSPLFDEMISDGYIETIGLAAPLCDIGKITIPEAILNKEDKTAEELLMIKEHPQAGVKILNDIKAYGDYNEFIQLLINLVESHHENWDGSGYPEGKAGMDIPLSAQISMLVDDYCTLTHEGNETYSREAALALMEKEAGIKYNPDIFAIMRKISRQLR